MSTAAVIDMAKGGRGRPRKDDGEATTRQIRVFEDLADKIGWIIEIEGGSVANLVDPLLRNAIETRYEGISAAVEAIKRARERGRKASG